MDLLKIKHLIAKGLYELVTMDFMESFETNAYSK
jgi:hypothetical protein